MITAQITPAQRIERTFAGKETDRIPFFLPATFYPAKLMGLSIQEYFSRPEHIVEGQLGFREVIGHDGFCSFTHVAAHMEAWGGETIYFKDGPPNCGAPVISSLEEVERLQPPSIEQSPALLNILKMTALLKKAGQGDVPIFGGVVSPFSMPIVQLGFERYLDMILDRPDLLERLLKINQAFCVDWANAQLAAGASAIAYVDPMASADLIPPEFFAKVGLPAAQETIKKIKGPTAYGLAGARVVPVIPYLNKSGVVKIDISAMDDLTEAKRLAAPDMVIGGNLNGISMCYWTEQEAEAAVKKAIAGGGPGGRFVLSEHHGELPWRVPMKILTTVAQAVQQWGTFPLNWVDGHVR